MKIDEQKSIKMKWRGKTPFRVSKVLLFQFGRAFSNMDYKNVFTNEKLAL